MNRLRFSSLVMFAALAAPSVHAQDALATIKTAEYALGMIRGPQRIDAINTMEVWATGTFSKEQISYHASYSYRTPAMRVEMTRRISTSGVAGGPLGQDARRIEVVNGRYAWNENVPGAGFITGSTATPTPAALPERLLDMWTTPHGVLKAAELAAKDAKVSRAGGATVVTFPLTGALGGIIVKMILNASNQVEKVETSGGNTSFLDASTENTYTGYKDLGEIATDVLFPSHIVKKRGGATLLDLTVTKVDANNPYVVFPVPEVVEKASRPPL